MSGRSSRLESEGSRPDAAVVGVLRWRHASGLEESVPSCSRSGSPGWRRSACRTGSGRRRLPASCSGSSSPAAPPPRPTRLAKPKRSSRPTSSNWPTPARIPEPAADGRRPVARVLPARPVTPLPVPGILRLAVVPLLPPGGAWPRRMRTMKIQPLTGLAGQAGAGLCQEPQEVARWIGIRDCEQLALVPRPLRVLASSSA